MAVGEMANSTGLHIRRTAPRVLIAYLAVAISVGVLVIAAFLWRSGRNDWDHTKCGEHIQLTSVGPANEYLRQVDCRR